MGAEERKISVALEGRMDSLSSTLQRAEQETERHTSSMAESFSKVDAGIMSVGRTMGLLATGAFAYGLNEAMKAAKQAEAATMGLAVTARYSGEDMAAASQAAKTLASDGLMSVAEASKGLQNLLSRGFSLEESVKLMNAFKDSAAYNRQASLEFGEAVVTATEGLKNENSILVDNAGVTKNVSQMWKEYAAAHGTTVDKLTQSEKRHAELNGVLKETEGQAGNAARMMNGLAGAEAQTEQKATELKTTLGVALQPAFKGLLTIMGPVVTGLRDMVYWVETLGVRAGGLWDKIKVRIEEKLRIPNAGEAMGFRDVAKRIAARDAQIDSAMDQAIADIVRRSDGATSVDIGPDSGKRRSDPSKAPEKEKGTDPTDQVYGAYASGLDSFNKQIRSLNPDLDEFDKKMADIDETLERQLAKFEGYTGVEKYVTSLKTAAEQAKLALQQDKERKEAAILPYSQDENSDSYLNALRQMSESQQLAFDQAAMQQGWAARNMAADQTATSQANRFSAAGDPLAGQILQLESERELYEQHWAMMTDSELVHNERKRQIRQWYEQELTAITVAGYRERLAFEGASTQKQIGMVASAGLQITNSVANSNKAMFMANKAFRLVDAAMELKAGISKTFNSFPVPYNFAMAALHATAGAVYLADIASASFSGPGGSPGGNYGGGTPTSPVVTQPTYGSSSQLQPLNITFKFDGTTLVDPAQFQKWMEETAAPLMYDLSVNRNVNFGFQPN